MPHAGSHEYTAVSVKARSADRFGRRVERLMRDPCHGVLAMRGPLTAELSSYSFSPLREGDFPLYKGSGDGLSAILLVAGEETSPGYLERLEHEYALRAELDVAWAARPVALTRYHGRLALVLE